jgi:hypothetical protein
MKPFRIGFIPAILSSILLYGAESINDQIAAIHKIASPQERVELMNKLKLQLASMNKEERAKAIGMLQTKMSGSMCTTTSQMPMNNMQQMPQNIIMQRQMGNTNSPMISPMGR